MSAEPMAGGLFRQVRTDLAFREPTAGCTTRPFCSLEAVCSTAWRRRPWAIWQKSSYCAQGEACLYVATTSSTRTVKLTESGDATGAILQTTPATWAAFVRTVKQDFSFCHA